MKANPLVLKATAAGVLLAGAAAAYAVGQAPVQRADVSQVKALASKVQSLPVSADDNLSVPPLPVPAAPPAVADKAVMRFSAPILPPGRSFAAAPVKPVTHVKPEAPAPPAPPAVPDSPVKNIALVGVTHADNKNSAWLVDTSNSNKETVSQGERAWGFTVKDVQDDEVTLERSGQDYVIRMGDKQVQVAEASFTAAPGEDGSGDFGDGQGQGRGRRNRSGGQNGGFGRNGGGQNSGFGNRGNFGGGNRGGGGATNSAGASPMIFGGGQNGGGGFGNRGSFGGGNNYRRQASAGGGYTGGGGGGYGGGGGNTNFRTSQGGSNPFSSASSAGSTSNPQTARRSGASLVGGATGTSAPKAITNPQTQRRLGTTSSNTPAFGQGSGNTGRTGQAGRQGSYNQGTRF